MPPQWRSLVFRRGNGGRIVRTVPVLAAGGRADRHYGWQLTAGDLLGRRAAHHPLSLSLAMPSAPAPAAGAPRPQSVTQALTEAFGHGSYVLLVLGFFTCGFQIFFIAVHLPAYLVDRGLPAWVGGWTLGAIGLFNIVGAIGAGWLSGFMPKRYILSVIYFARAVAILVYIMLPPNAVVTLIFGAVLGLLWLSDGAADVGAGGDHVRHALARHAVRLRLLQPPGRRLPRRVARRPAVRAHRLLRRGVVALDPARRAVGGRSTCRSSRSRSRALAAAGLIGSSPARCEQCRRWRRR
jgi:MFS family permease